MKKKNAYEFIGLIVITFLSILAGAAIMRFGWNDIITTIVPANKISLAQAFGLDAVLSFIFARSSDVKLSTSKIIGYHISKNLFGFLLIWLASVLI